MGRRRRRNGRGIREGWKSVGPSGCQCKIYNGGWAEKKTRRNVKWMAAYSLSATTEVF